MFLPLHLKARHTPDGKIVFYWGAYHDRGGKKQSAYRLTAGSLDTGWVESDDQTAVLALREKAGTRVEWSVTIRDEKGEVSEKAESSFTYWHLDSFAGEWISDPDSPQSVVSLFRKTFRVEEKPDEAFLFLSAAGIAEASLNGEKVGGRILAPNLTNFKKRRLYNAYPVEVSEGENELILSLGDGWRRNISDYLGKEQRKTISFFGTAEGEKA